MKINLENFRKLCGLNGTTPEQLAREIRRHKTTVYRALSRPQQYKPTYAALVVALPVTTVPNGHDQKASRRHRRAIA